MNKESLKTIRVRVAPSPTGLFHIGLARTALFNYLFAKKNQGAFILRIEDTDIERSEARFEEDIIENLRWLGIDWGEGPYRQSERLEIYAEYLKKLLNEDKAYHCFCSEEELEARRQYQISIGQAPCYSGKCAGLSKKEVKKYLTEGKSSVIRFRVPNKKVEFDDLIRGHIEFDTSLIGDMVIAKDYRLAKGQGEKDFSAAPLYNFSVVIDDFEMKISHVIRGEDHISNTPLQILLGETLGFPRPKYAHLPLILGPDRTKLSKRHGAASVSEYRKAGYLPEALVNFMAFLGWNPGDEREIYSLASLIKEFSLEKVQKGGAIFNIKRLDWLNAFYIRQKSAEKLTELVTPYLIKEDFIIPIFASEPLFGGYAGRTPMEVKKFKIKKTEETISISCLEKIIAIYQERLKKLSEISELVGFFFEKRLEYDRNLLRWKEMSDEEIKNSLDKTEKTSSKIEQKNWTKENLEKGLMPEAEKMENRGCLLWPFRVAITGKQASAGPFEIAEILGKEKTLKRIKEAKELITS